MIAFVLMFVAGWLLYTFIEYAVHRWGGHSPRWKKGWRDHLDHHANPRRFPGTHIRLGILLVPLSILLFETMTVAAASGFIAGAIFGWALFELTHRTLHGSEKGPRTAYGRWIARNHLHHHFVNARTNHGITSPLWDMLLGTYEPVALLVVRGNARTIPPWLELRPASAAAVERIMLARRGS